MGLINYSNIENNVPATANMFNERFGQIVNELNGNLDGTNMKDGSIPVQKLAVDIFSRLYPIGTVYTNGTDPTNPGVLLGFGTWVPHAEGRVIAGKAESGTFNTAGAQLGVEEVTLTAAQMPVHNHGVNDPGHSHSVSLNGSNSDVVTNSRDIEWSHAVDTVTRGTSSSGTGISIQNAGNGQAHTNIQPTQVDYVWMRIG